MLFLGSMFCLCIATISLPHTGVASASAPRQTAAGCATIDSYQVSAPRAAAALSDWTAQHMADSESFSPANLVKILKSSRGRIPMPRWAQQCQPALDSVADGVASEAAVRSAAALPGTQSIDGYPTVGKFFFKVAGISLNCTATVIGDARNNPKRALILTAAHCIEGVLSGFRYMTGDWMFAPMWHDNKFPYGKWAVKSVYIEHNWMHCAHLGSCQTNPNYDYAVLVMQPQHGHGVGWYTGEDGWHVNEPKVITVRIVGIPGNSAKAKVNVTSSQTVTLTGSQGIGKFLARKASTPGFTDGTSGGPWFYSFSARTGRGLLLGDTGGYQDGGPSSGTPSYSSYWTSSFSALVAMAAQHE